MKKILVYDINQINFFKYIPDLLIELANEENFEIILCYEEDTDNSKANEFLTNFINIKVGLFKSIKSILNLYNIDLVIVNAQRIPDSLVVSYANKLKIPTLMIQHGMYNGYLKRNHELYYRKLFKTFKYLIYSFQIGVISKKNVFKTALNFILAFSFNKSYQKLFKNYDLIYTNQVHVYGNYWVDYHKNFFGYTINRTEFKITGYPELLNSFSNRKVNFCYIAQSLYEDGRISLKDISNTLEILKNLNKKHSLIVKRHPRSLDIIYQGYNLELTDDIPDSDVYIGHYSSLLALPITKGKKLAIIPIEGHSIPEYFKNNSKFVNSDSELVTFLKEKSISNNLNDVFSFPISSTEHKNIVIALINKINKV